MVARLLVAAGRVERRPQLPRRLEHRTAQRRELVLLVALVIVITALRERRRRKKQRRRRARRPRRTITRRAEQQVAVVVVVEPADAPDRRLAVTFGARRVDVVARAPAALDLLEPELPEERAGRHVRRRCPPPSRWSC